MTTSPSYVQLHPPGGVPVKARIRGVPLEDSARAQLENVARLPFVGPWVAVMPDVHWGIGATVGSVIPTRGAIVPAAVGVDIGCGMMAVCTDLAAAQLPDDLRPVRSAIERAVPHGRTHGGGPDDRGAWRTLPDRDLAWLEEGSTLFSDYVEAVSWAQDFAAENRRLPQGRRRRGRDADGLQGHRRGDGRPGRPGRGGAHPPPSGVREGLTRPPRRRGGPRTGRRRVGAACEGPMTTDELTIDGSQGEGGGQILRSALSLSLVTGRPFRVVGVRAGRKAPGLLRQHLAAVRAAATVGRARVEGAELGSLSVRFAPEAIVPGEHAFAVGGAGSATLVLQTVLPALLVASAPSRLVLEGGTHNPWAPPYDFLARSFLPLLASLGARARTTLERRGYFPAGGGRFTATVEPVAAWTPLALTSRGAILARRATVLLANLPRRVAASEESALRRLLPADLWAFDRVVEEDGRGPGNAVLLDVACEHVHEVFVAFGMRELRADEVVDGAVGEYRAWLAADVPVGPHLADQLLLPLAIGAGGTFRTVAPTAHARTNADVIRQFLPDARIELDRDGPATTVRVAPGRAPSARAGGGARSPAA